MQKLTSEKDRTYLLAACLLRCSRERAFGNWEFGREFGNLDGRKFLFQFPNYRGNWEFELRGQKSSGRAIQKAPSSVTMKTPRYTSRFSRADCGARGTSATDQPQRLPFDESNFELAVCSIHFRIRLFGIAFRSPKSQ